MSDRVSPIVLCRLDEIPEGEGLGFTLGQGSERTLIAVFRQGERVHGYVNSCPHVGTPLDLIPDRFMTFDKRHILCATHGARFRVYDGYCFAGPCQGARLEAVPVRIADGMVILGGSVDVAARI